MPDMQIDDTILFDNDRFLSEPKRSNLERRDYVKKNSPEILDAE